MASNGPLVNMRNIFDQYSQPENRVTKKSSPLCITEQISRECRVDEAEVERHG